jgi:ABC-2 type transport system permease protein
VKTMIELYLIWIKTSITVMFQYRFSQLMWLVGMIAEPVIYLVVWTSVARAQGGSVGGYTAGEFAAYYIGWTLVRHMNIALTPYAFEGRVLRGELSPELLRPAHPFHFDLAWFLGMKVITMTLWLPIAAALVVLFQPTLNPAPWQAVAFAVALVTAFIMRFVLLWVLGMATFWITRVSALFEVYFTAELFLSGRLVPMDLMPLWVQQVANFLPFRWAFGFQLELLLGRLTPEQALLGFAAQAFWFSVGVIALNLLWRAGVKRYSAVGA